MDYTAAYVMAGIGSGLVLIWTIFFFMFKDKYDTYIEALQGQNFILPELFFIGYGVLDLFHINLRSSAGRKKEKKLAEIYGERYAGFYHCSMVAAQITYLLTLFPFGFLLGAMLNDVVMGGVILIATVAIVVSLDMQASNSIESRRSEILSDFPDVLSKLTLLINAGMVVREAWNKVAFSGDRTIYMEMRAASEEMNNGVSEPEAMQNFAHRCVLKELRKFASLMVQNIQKGGPDFALQLRDMNNESWEEKRHLAKRKGELAGSKLLIPTLIMFVGILIMIIVPIFTGL